MRHAMFRSLLAGCAVLLAAAVLAPAAEDKKADEGFTKLFSGTDLKGWKTFLDAPKADPKKTFSVKEGAVIVSGNPNGYFYTEKPYSNYVLRYDWRFKRPAKLKEDKEFGGNSGLLVHIQKIGEGFRKGTPWPKSVEIQGMNRNHGQLLFLGVKGMDVKYDKDAKEKAVKKVGEWNTTEVTCKADGSIVVKVNGAEVASGKSELTSGHIGFQSEGAEIHFKNILIKEMK